MKPLVSKFATFARAAFLCSLLAFSAAIRAEQEQDKEHDALRVCADPNYLPFSNRHMEGYENKIAEMLAHGLKLPLEYTWFPQRLGFIRNTLRAEDPENGRYKCNIVMGVPHGYELVISTDPYYRSTYALVFIEGRTLDAVNQAMDLVEVNSKSPLKIGVSERSPGALWLAKHDMHEQIVAYVAQSGDPNIGPGEREGKDLADGKLDATILWGPVAGHVTQTLRDQGHKVRMIPMISEPGVRFHYAISSGVRFGDSDWKKVINEKLHQYEADIAKLLNSYNVPLVDERGNLLDAADS